LKIEATVDAVGGNQQVVDAKSSGTMFRSFEQILINRKPRDAIQLTQRICGVCPIAHAMASSLTLENAYAVAPAPNGRIMRNLVLGANYIQSHVLHFYHLAALDYINTTGVIDVAPWTPHYVTPDMVGRPTADVLVQHYRDALKIRRQAHQMGAIFGGRFPCASNFIDDGSTNRALAVEIAMFRDLLTDIRAFIDDVYVPDVLEVAGAFPEYYNIGTGCGNLLAYGVFDLNSDGSSKLLARGRYSDGAYASVSPADIVEYVMYSKYTASSGNLNPLAGVTVPQSPKPGAYSWLKSPRYLNLVHEVGPLARMWVNNDYRRGISVLDRIAARALETKKVANAMDGWLNQLTPGEPTYTTHPQPASGTGIGLTEAARGALGHWMQVANGVVSRYQIITPTNWNASPRDDMGQKGPIEQALMGTVVADAAQPIELLRVIHSFDPCLACSVHMLRPGQRTGGTQIEVRPSIT
jgi:hydrogenase large subunit